MIKKRMEYTKISFERAVNMKLFRNKLKNKKLMILSRQFLIK